MPPELPRVEVVYALEPGDTQCSCGKTLERIGEQVLEQLAVIPQQYYVIRHVRPNCSDGRLPISNIKSEHVAKTIAIARKNFLFADTAAGAEASGRIFSLIETARTNGHNPQRYLCVLLTELPNVTTVEQIEALLPWNLTPDQVAQRYTAYPAP